MTELCIHDFPPDQCGLCRPRPAAPAAPAPIKSRGRVIPMAAGGNRDRSQDARYKLGRSRQAMADKISRLAGVPPFHIDVAHGQVETRAWLEAVADAVGVSPLGVPRKPQIAKKIVEALGGTWPPNGFTGGQDGMSHLSSPGFNALCTAIENFYDEDG